MTPNERQFLLHHLKKGPALDREGVTEYMLHLVRDCLKLDLPALVEAKLQQWRNGDGFPARKPAFNETFLY